MAGIIEVKDQGKVRIYDADNSNYIDIVVPSTVSANRTITIPDATFTIPTSGGADDGSITKAKLADQVDVFSGTSLNAADLGAGVHIKTADTGASVSTDADELVVEGTRSGMTFLAANNNYSYINFGDDGGSGSGSIRYGHPNNDLTFYTNGADQWTLDSSGNFLPSATDHGIYLGTTSAAASNLLDDYEEGTWTPGVNQGTINNVGSTYTKIGNKVTIWSSINTFSNRTSTETVEVSSLPFSIASQNQNRVVGSIVMNYSNKLVHASYSRSNSTIAFYISIAGAFVPLKFNDLNNSASNIIFTATYEAA